MEDKLRYRAWDKENKKYIYGVENGLEFYSTAGNVQVMSLAEIEQSDKYDLEQCTDIKDYLDRLIYEGDIVKNLRSCMCYEVVANTDNHVLSFVGKIIGNSDEKISCFEKHAIVGNVHEPLSQDLYYHRA